MPPLMTWAVLSLQETRNIEQIGVLVPLKRWRRWVENRNRDRRVGWRLLLG